MAEDIKKSKGRPKKETVGQTIGIRLTDDIIMDLDSIVDLESKRTGYRLDRVNVIRKAITEYIQRYDKG